jgi:glycosyltransferase involved in cell wall biosynthesis
VAENKKKILVINDYYWPGFKTGGMRTLVNMVDRLGDRFEFFVVTRDHDGRHDKTPYTTVKIGDWNNIGKARVFYVPGSDMKISTIRKLVSEVNPDAIYLNSFFATPVNYLLLLRRLGKIKCRVIMSPCGELMAAAMEFKKLKKKLHIFAGKITGLHKGLIWKASTELEKQDIEKALGKKKDIFVALDLPAKTIFPDYDQAVKPKKTPGELKLVFLARFARSKNFGFLPGVLGDMAGKITVDIIGDLEDKEYWEECLEKIKKLPAEVTVNYEGVIHNRFIPKKLSGYHFLVLPTMNENFGHVFLEALSAGCPLIISNRTLWLGLAEKGIGWDIPLENEQLWAETIKRCVEMDDTVYRKMSARAREYAEDWLADESLEKDTIRVIDEALTPAS